LGEGEPGPHLARAEATRVPSFVLIRPTVWPLYTNVADRTDRRGRSDRTGQDDGPIA